MMPSNFVFWTSSTILARAPSGTLPSFTTLAIALMMAVAAS